MSVSPPGDIVLEVARAADPAAVRLARAKLESAAGAAVTGAFEAVTGTAGANLRGRLQGTSADGVPEAYRKFEAMVLQSFIKPMMPSDAETVYGGGLSGEMWKSLLAQEMGDALAENGGIGIADQILRDRYTVENGEKVPVRGISDGADKAETDRRSLMSDALVHEFQRRTAQSLSLDGGVTATLPDDQS